MSILNNKKKRSAQLNETPSRVLLTCVYDTIVLEIANEAVFAKFAPYGTIIRILIFERGEVTKFFIEFESISSAMQARKGLDGTKLYEAICKMSIYYSTFASVDLKHESTEGVALEYFPQKQPEFIALYQDYPNSARSFDSKTPIFNSCVLLEPQGEVQFCNDEVEQVKYQQHVLRNLTNQEHLLASQLQKTIENDINSLLKSQKKKPIKELNRLKTHSKLENNEHFLCFSIYESIDNSKVYNLFSNFGNISYIKQTKNCIYLKYKSQEFVDIARSYLEGHFFSGNHLAFFTLGEINKELPLEEQFSQITYYDQNYDRFTLNKSITINPPSCTLHVSSLKRDYCRVDVLRQAFEKFGRVEKVELLNHCAEKNMALVKFASLQESFEAISEMHGRHLGGRKMQISFTKSKLSS